MTTANDPIPDADGELPLSGIVVIDLTHIYNGPYATFLMAMAGATVIKIEPRNGEHLRHRAEAASAGVPFAMLNLNKRAVTLDFTKERGRGLLLQMIERADVVAENFAPGVLDRRGLGYEAACRSIPRSSMPPGPVTACRDPTATIPRWISRSRRCRASSRRRARRVTHR